MNHGCEKKSSNLFTYFYLSTQIITIFSLYVKIILHILYQSVVQFQYIAVYAICALRCACVFFFFWGEGAEARKRGIEGRRRLELVLERLFFGAREECGALASLSPPALRRPLLIISSRKTDTAPALPVTLVVTSWCIKWNEGKNSEVASFAHSCHAVAKRICNNM